MVVIAAASFVYCVVCNCYDSDDDEDVEQQRQLMYDNDDDEEDGIVVVENGTISMVNPAFSSAISDTQMQRY